MREVIILYIANIRYNLNIPHILFILDNTMQRAPVLDPAEEFHPVQCDSCKTEVRTETNPFTGIDILQVAMYDTEEVYHFFNVVASHT